MTDGTEPEKGQDFIRDIVQADLDAGKYREIVTRFPPEPNGYLHIGHAKSIALNFGIAQEFAGRCHLRFDDTNPTKEEQEYIDSIQADVRWLGYDWGTDLYYASDYFERLYQWAEGLIRDGHAYVDDQSQEEIRVKRGTLTEPGKNSPFRDRSVEENLDLFRRMKAGEFAFYGDLLGCPEGRSAATWVDFDFYGHQFVAHLDDRLDEQSRHDAWWRADQLRNAVDGHDVPVPHFGVLLEPARLDGSGRSADRRRRRVRHRTAHALRGRGGRTVDDVPVRPVRQRPRVQVVRRRLPSVRPLTMTPIPVTAIPVTVGDDPRLDDYRALNDQAFRRAFEGDELFIAEGFVAIERLIDSDHEIRSVLLAPSRVERFRARLDELVGSPRPGVCRRTRRDHRRRRLRPPPWRRRRSVAVYRSGRSATWPRPALAWPCSRV